MSKKKILILVGALLPVLLIVGGLALATQGFSQPMVLSLSVGNPSPVPTETRVAVVVPADVLPTPVFGTGVMMDLGSKVVNLADPGGYRYLKVGVVLELMPASRAYYEMKGEEKTKEEEKIRTDVTNRRAIVDDALINCLSDKTFGDIFTLAGKEKLKDELKSAINKGLGTSAPVTRVYFTDFVIN